MEAVDWSLQAFAGVDQRGDAVGLRDDYKDAKAIQQLCCYGRGLAGAGGSGQEGGGRLKDHAWSSHAPIRSRMVSSSFFTAFTTSRAWPLSTIPVRLRSSFMAYNLLCA